MKIKCVIIDDEPYARQVIREFIEEIDFLQIVGEAENAHEALDLFHSQEIGLMFLDIEMPKVSGLSFLQSLTHKPVTIITTAYQEFAINGFELDVVDYLLKPIREERLLKAVSKALEIIKARTVSTSIHADHFFVKVDNKLERISINDVFYFEAYNNYVKIHTANEKRVAYLTIKGLDDMLPKENFIRIHKSFIVNIDKVHHVVEDQINLVDGRSIPLSINFQAGIKEYIKSRLLKR